MKKPSTFNTHGFTLIELAFVLVIVSLITVVTLTGRDLVRVAQTNAVTSQIQALETAVNQFRIKYNALPGDYNRAFEHDMGPTGATVINGNGNGLLEANINTGAVTPFGGEIQQFWVHLAGTNMYPGSFLGNSGAGTINRDFPANELDKGGIGVFHIDAVNYYAVGISDGVTFGSGLTPEEARRIDLKLDDGKPVARGLIVPVATGNTLDNPGTATVAANAGDAGCSLSVGPGSDDLEYNVGNQSNECPLQIRMTSG